MLSLYRERSVRALSTTPGTSERPRNVLCSFTLITIVFWGRVQEALWPFGSMEQMMRGARVTGTARKGRGAATGCAGLAALAPQPGLNLSLGICVWVSLEQVPSGWSTFSLLRGSASCARPVRSRSAGPGAHGHLLSAAETGRGVQEERTLGGAEGRAQEEAPEDERTTGLLCRLRPQRWHPLSRMPDWRKWQNFLSSQGMSWT